MFLFYSERTILRKMQTSEENNSKILGIITTKFSVYYFSMNMNIILVVSSYLHYCIFNAEFYFVYFLPTIFCYQIGLCYFRNVFPCFFQKRIFSTYSASTIFGNMQSALLVCKSLQIFSCMVAKTSFSSNVTFLELFLLVKCLHINLMYWRQNADLDITQ